MWHNQSMYSNNNKYLTLWTLTFCLGKRDGVRKIKAFDSFYLIAPLLTMKKRISLNLLPPQPPTFLQTHIHTAEIASNLNSGYILSFFSTLRTYYFYNWEKTMKLFSFKISHSYATMILMMRLYICLLLPFISQIFQNEHILVWFKNIHKQRKVTLL